MNEGESAARTKRPRFIVSHKARLLSEVAVVCVVSVTLLSALSRYARSRRTASCYGNLRQIGWATLQYTQEYDGRFPVLINGKETDGSTNSWRSQIRYYAYSTAEKMLSCPENPAAKSGIKAYDGLPLSYDVADCGPIRKGKPLQLSQIKAPTSTFLAFEENGDNAQAQQTGALWDKDDGDANWTNIVFAGHLSTSNYLFVDGHVKAMRPTGTIADGLNRWNINNKAPVSPRALAKLQAAQRNFD